MTREKFEEKLTDLARQLREDPLSMQEKQRIWDRECQDLRRRFEMSRQMEQIAQMQPRLNFGPPNSNAAQAQSIAQSAELIESYKNGSWGDIPNTNNKPIPKFKAGKNLMEYVDDMIKLGGKGVSKERVGWLKTFKRCVLPANVRDTIEEAIITVLRGNVVDEWGMSETFEKGITNSILLYGPPGTGKTMIAESIAAVLNRDLLKLGTADIQSQVPGQAERNISKAFETAKKENACVMFDECDSLLYNRESVGAIMAAEINHLLGAIENFDGVVIMTTNRLGKLDPALQRRIVAKVELPLPGMEQRIEIWKNLIPKKMPVEETMNYEQLARSELSGGEIKNAIMLAARRAIAKGEKKVLMEHFENAVRIVEQSKKDFDSTQGVKLQEVHRDLQLNLDRVALDLMPHQSLACA